MVQLYGVSVIVVVVIMYDVIQDSHSSKELVRLFYLVINSLGLGLLL